MQSQTLIPLVSGAAPPTGWPDVQHSDGAATLTWRGVPEAADATLEAVLLSVLQFVAGGVLRVLGCGFLVSAACKPRALCSASRWQTVSSSCVACVLV